MGKRDMVEVLIVTLYVTGALLVVITAYLLFLKKYRKRGRMEMLNNLVFTTSRYDVYDSKTQFLIDLPKSSHIELNLLNKDEQFVKQLLKDDLNPGLYPVNFDPADFENGIYFLSLKSDNAAILRRITIDKKS